MKFNRLNHSILGEIRPRFNLKINCEPELALEHILSKRNSDRHVFVLRAKDLLFIRTHKLLQHYWSPEMSVRIEKDEYNGEVHAHCLIGPNQLVWSMFALIYAAICIATFFAGIFGYVQYQTSGSSPFLWVIPFGIIAMASVFITSKYGQRKGRDQMLHLVSFLYHGLDEITEVERSK